MSTKSNNVITVPVLKTKDQWTIWNNALMGQANTLNFWKYLDPVNRTELPVEPKIPDPSRYQAKPAVVADRDQRLASAQADVERRRTENPNIPIPDAVREPHDIEDLSAEGGKLYRIAYDVYDRRYKTWEQYQKSREKITTWIQSSVDQQLQIIHCKGHRSVIEWYDSLRMALAITDVHQRQKEELKMSSHLAAFPQYVKKPKDWLDAWERQMAICSEYGCASTQAVELWYDSLGKAMTRDYKAGAFTTFFNMLKLQNKPKYNTGELDYRIIASQIRDFIDENNLQIEKKAKAGAFPALAGTPDEQNNKRGNEGDSEEDEEEKPPKKAQRNESSGRGRGRGSSHGRGGKTGSFNRERKPCEACGSTSHKLKSCYYVQPEKKPDWFILNETTMSAVKRNLDNNHEGLADKVANLKAKKEQDD